TKLLLPHRTLIPFIAPDPAGSAFICDKSCGYSPARTLCGHPAGVWNNWGEKETSMLRCRLAAGGLALLPALVVNASAQNCPLPWTCQDSQPSAESVEPKATDARRTQNVKNNLPSRKGSPRTARPDLRRLAAAGSHQRLAMRHQSQRDNDEERKEP